MYFNAKKGIKQVPPIRWHYVIVDVVFGFPELPSQAAVYGSDIHTQRDYSLVEAIFVISVLVVALFVVSFTVTLEAIIAIPAYQPRYFRFK
jgi:hypothetical protein